VAVEVGEDSTAGALVKILTRDDFQPRVVQGHGSRRTDSVIQKQQLLNKIDSFLADVRPRSSCVSWLALGRHLEYFIIILAIKRRRANQQHVGNHSNRPDVTFLGVLASQNLWGNVEGRAGNFGQLLPFFDRCRCTEVNNLSSGVRLV